MTALPCYRARLLGIVALLALLTFPILNNRSVSAATDLVVGEEALVSQAQGDQVRLRAAPSYQAAILTTVPEGWLVAVLDGPVEADDGSDWYQVIARGQTGYMDAAYLVQPGSQEVTSAEAVSAAEVVAAGTATTTANLNLRASPSLSAAILKVIPAGSSVATTGASQNGFWQVTYTGTAGWAASQYLTSGSSSPVIDTATVIDGSLNLRAGPGTGYAILTVMPDGAEVGITGSPQNGFYPVRYQGTDGWAYGQYLSIGQTPPPEEPGEVLDTAVTTTSLNLRSGPGTSYSIKLVMPAGAQVGITGSPQNGFYPVRYQGTDGFARGTYLDLAEAPGEVIDTAWVIEGSLNLRSGPGTSYSIKTVMPDGAEVGITGSSQNGFYPVRYQGLDGWAYGQYLSFEGPQPAPTEPPTQEETAWTTSSLNLRSGPGTSYSILTVMPMGAELTITGALQNNFYPVNYNGTDGFASADYITFEEPTTPPPGEGLLIWPVTGGTWTIIQGYNGGTHQGENYYYSLDIQRVEGASATAGQPVYAPASGTVLWTSGGLLIGMGNGYGIAMFHITIDSSIGPGTSLTQGQYVGFISGPGGVGYQVTPHVDLTLWQLPNGGGYPRISAPFTGQFAISGMDLPDTGGQFNMWGGTRFNP